MNQSCAFGPPSPHLPSRTDVYLAARPRKVHPKTQGRIGPIHGFPCTLRLSTSFPLSPCIPGHEAIPTALSPSSADAAARILTFRLHAIVGVALVLGLEVKVLMRGAEEHLTS
jgi:hypothetical protein